MERTLSGVVEKNRRKWQVYTHSFACVVAPCRLRTIHMFAHQVTEGTTQWFTGQCKGLYVILRRRNFKLLSNIMFLGVFMVQSHFKANTKRT